MGKRSGVALIGLVLALCSVGTVCGDGDVNTLYENGVTAYTKGNYDAARSHFQKALKKDPKHCPSLYASASLLYESRDYEDAGDLLDTVLSIRPGDLKSVLLSGKVGLALGRMEGARENFRKILSRYPTNLGATIGMAVSELKMGNPFTGEDWLRKACALRPRNRPLRETYETVREANRKSIARERAANRRNLLSRLNQVRATEGRKWMHTWAQDELAKLKREKSLLHSRNREIEKITVRGEMREQWRVRDPRTGRELIIQPFRTGNRNRR